MTLGERLLEYRTKSNMSQDTLAEKLGVTRQTISKWETDQSTPDFNKILPLCEVYGITTDELIKGEKKEQTIDSDSKTYAEKRNKQKATVISTSVFLYCVGTFSLPYMIEGLKYEESHAVMFTMLLWTIATVMLIYFFVSHPRPKEEVEEKILKDEKNLKERRITEIVALVFLIIYLLVSFTTGAWYITWIIWLVFAISSVIIKLIFDVRGEKNEQ